ncbi:MAG TPA: DNA-3-methyladenine glycosylase, partial [Longimicrobiaceae bacterium]|nr:DNA-3-methyladenine glycosylase [Longimicrobiaceae bacterium]
EVARDLLGAFVVSEVGGTRCVGRIVETEAYSGPDDEASHAHVRFGKTARNAAMFETAGIAYVYRIYGMHWCLNVVTGPRGFPAAVLIRAAQPVAGAETAAVRRPGRPERDLMRGPGNLCRAMGIDGALNFHPLDRPPLWIAAGDPVAEERVARGPRIGITRAAEAPLRFWVRGDPHVSR